MTMTPASAKALGRFLGGKAAVGANTNIASVDLLRQFLALLDVVTADPHGVDIPRPVPIGKSISEYVSESVWRAAEHLNKVTLVEFALISKALSLTTHDIGTLVFSMFAVQHLRGRTPDQVRSENGIVNDFDEEVFRERERSEAAKAAGVPAPTVKMGREQELQYYLLQLSRRGLPPKTGPSPPLGIRPTPVFRSAIEVAGCVDKKSD